MKNYEVLCRICNSLINGDQKNRNIRIFIIVKRHHHVRIRSLSRYHYTELAEMPRYYLFETLILGDGEGLKYIEVHFLSFIHIN